jgi:hypothetical protein
MIEQALIERLCVLIGALPLSPAPKSIGVIEPQVAADMPAVVVSIEQNTRLKIGLGERSSLITRGALAWQAQIDLANPSLPEEPSFSLLSSDRTRLNLPHGGLVRSDGSSGNLTAADIQVTVDDAPLNLVAAAPGSGEFSAEPLSGALQFGAPLAGSGIARAHYFLGQWEQRVVRGHGILGLSTFAATGQAVQNVSDQVLSALGDGIPSSLGLTQFSVLDIGSVGLAPGLADARQRLVRFRFELEQEINVPDSSGGIIQRIPVRVVLAQ